MNSKIRIAIVVAVIALLSALMPSAHAANSTPGCMSGREFNRVGGLHQTRADVRRIVGARGVVVSDHVFDGWNADAGVKPRDEYGAPLRLREIRRYAMCARFARNSGARVVFVEFRVRADGTERVEQSRMR